MTDSQLQAVSYDPKRSQIQTVAVNHGVHISAVLPYKTRAERILPIGFWSGKRGGAVSSHSLLERERQ